MLAYKCSADDELDEDVDLELDEDELDEDDDELDEDFLDEDYEDEDE